MKKLNVYLKIGMLINSAMLLLKHLLVELPDFVYCLGLGAGLGFLLLGAVAEKNDISKIRDFKMNLLRKFICK